MIEGLFQPTHLIIILVIILIVFGPGKLPEIGSSLGKGIKEFKHSTRAAVEDESPAAARKTQAVGAASQLDPGARVSASNPRDV